MSFDLTKWAIQELEIQQTCKAVLVAICTYCDDGGIAFPSQNLIAKCASVDVKTASRTIAKLVEMGLVTIIKKGVYRVNKVTPTITKSDPQSPKVILNHHKQGDGESPKSDPQSPQGDGESPPYNKPIINQLTNHKNIIKKENPPDKIPKQKNIATRLKDEWQPSQENLDYAKLKGIPNDRIEHEIEGFKDHWLSKTKSNTSLNWSRNWQTWVRNSVDWRYSGHAKQINYTKPNENQSRVVTRAEIALRMLSDATKCN